MNSHKLIIIGSGPAGLTAAIYASRANLNPLMIGGLTYGGQLMLTTEVENFPGFPKGILGPELMQSMIEQAERFGTKILYEDVSKVDFNQKPFKLWSDGGEHSAEAVIIATGASSLWLGLPSEEKFRGKGISSCATCDGAFFREKEVIVVGGGDSAMEEATYLTKFASKVTIVNRSEKFRASKIMLERAQSNPKIGFLTNKVIEEFSGDVKLTSVSFKDVVSGQVSQMAIDGAFIAIGHKPNTDIFQNQIKLDEKGFIVRTGREQDVNIASAHSHFPTATSVEGVFVAGDVHDHHYKQAITAAAFGCMAAMDAEKYLNMDHG
jgi:thioredoxin reductase (NADPH)